ncbi:MAG: glycosyltransferase family 9 protein [Candidatus Cloacimonetes bacterium]|nr:glycosyltransferase family 9 protein [Candidatus Cloacimonadota bacterium]
MKNIIVIQLARLGDIIQSVPLLEEIKSVYIGFNIYLFVNDIFKESSIFLNNINIIPVILENLVDEKGDILTNQGTEQYLHNLTERFENQALILINLNNSCIAKKIAAYVYSEKKLGFGAKDSEEWTSFVTSFLNTRHLGSVNLVDIFKRFLKKDYQNYLPLKKISISNSSSNEKKQQQLSPTKGLKSIGIQCGARNIKRQFTQQHYIDITSHYLEKNYIVYLLGLKSEMQVAKKILDKINHPNLIDTTGKTDLSELVNIISKCERIYTPDTGTMHLAALCGTPFTAFFCGPAYPYETLAYTEKCEVFLPSWEVFKCYPCKDDALCPNNYACHRFSFKKIFTEGYDEDFLSLDVKYDEIGQVLTPIDEMALLWRCFMRYYFNSIQDSLNVFLPISTSMKKKIERELKLWEVLDINDLEASEVNFYFLKPLVYYNKFKAEKRLITCAIDYFKEAVT